ncbi:MAG: nucleoside hydrolase, partial [Phycisphaerales bacterium]
ITQHPQAKRWIRQIVIMGGAVRVGYNNKPPIVREWNIRSDVQPAQTVFPSGIPLVVAPWTPPHRQGLLSICVTAFSELRHPCASVFTLYMSFGVRRRQFCSILSP